MLVFVKSRLKGKWGLGVAPHVYRYMRACFICVTCSPSYAYSSRQRMRASTFASTRASPNPRRIVNTS
eukprot:9408695-Heterocapsa_arctica.AAC.1